MILYFINTIFLQHIFPIPSHPNGTHKYRVYSNPLEEILERLIDQTHNDRQCIFSERYLTIINKNANFLSKFKLQE